jgi:hypothetical protein
LDLLPDLKSPLPVMVVIRRSVRAQVFGRRQ